MNACPAIAPKRTPLLARLSLSPFRQPLSGSALLGMMTVGGLTAVLRLLYPGAVLLLGSDAHRAALGMAGSSLVISVARSIALNWAARSVRRDLFDGLGTALSRCPAILAEKLSVQQVDAEIVRGEPWVETLLSAQLPTLLGTLVALPWIGWGAARLVGLPLMLLASGALVIAVALGALAAEAASRTAQKAWAGYLVPARLIEGGLRGRAEIQAHGLGRRYRTSLLAAVEQWSRIERRGYLARAMTGWVVPMVAIGIFILVAPSVGFGYRDLLDGVTSRTHVLGALLAVAAIPSLWGISRAFAEISAAYPFWRAFRTIHDQGLPSVEGESTPRASAVHFEDVTFSYPSSKAPQSPTWRIDLNWEHGESIAIIGSNGSGKTTLALMLLGLVQPGGGRVVLTDERGECRDRVTPGAIAYLPQRAYFDEQDTIQSAIHFLAPESPLEEISALLGALNGKAYDSKALQTPMSELSIGQARVVALARVLLRHSHLTILDEPEANLDAAARIRLLHVLEKETEHRAFLVITHHQDFASLAHHTFSIAERMLDGGQCCRVLERLDGVERQGTSLRP